MTTLRGSLLLVAGATGLIAVAAIAAQRVRWGNTFQQGGALPLLQIPFRHAIIDPTPLTGADCCTDVLAIGDVDGDGRPDVVVGAQGSEGLGLVWYESPDWRRHEAARGEFTTDGKVHDLDGDGDQDIIVGDETRGLFWYENFGSGLQWSEHKVGGGYVHDIEVGDLDGDGRTEVVTCSKKEVTLWTRDPSNAWRSQTLLTARGEGIALADLDRDGRVDVVFGARWLENTGASSLWPAHVISRDWPADTRVTTADMNDDGRLDVVLTASEGPGRLSWFEAPVDPRARWRERRIGDARLTGAHSLAVSDFDRDGDLDVAVAEMHTSEPKRVLVYVNGGGERWTVQTLATSGSHNMQVADVDGDGDADIVGKNYAGEKRPIEIWENLSADNFGGLSSSAAPFLAGGWKYVALDAARDDDQKGKMGLVAGDLDGDLRLDVVAGSFAYFNPGADLGAPWRRARVGADVDVLFAIDIDRDAEADLIAARGTELLWIEAADRTGSKWSARVVGRVPEARTQGYVAAQIEAGGREELVFTRGPTLAYLVVPANPDRDEWPLVVITTGAEEEGVAAADIDRDGDLDLVATASGGHQVLWFGNPGRRGGDWTAHPIGGADNWLDRVRATDVNGDGRIDVVVSEETQDWHYNAFIWWFEAPADPAAESWIRHRISVLRSVNSLDVVDFDDDGDADVMAAEHTDMRESGGAPNNLTVLFENVDGTGRRWKARPIEAGSHSSHLGARTFDLDGASPHEVVSLGWNQFRTLHLWWASPGTRASTR